jgi:hypothetical protein
MISFIVVGCASNQPTPLPPKPVVNTVYIYPDCGIAPKRDKVEHRDIIWGYIYDEDGDILYTLTPKGYEDLAFNTSEIIKGAKQLKGEVAFYKQCIEATNNGGE